MGVYDQLWAMRSQWLSHEKGILKNWELQNICRSLVLGQCLLLHCHFNNFVSKLKKDIWKNKRVICIVLDGITHPASDKFAKSIDSVKLLTSTANLHYIQSFMYCTLWFQCQRFVLRLMMKRWDSLFGCLIRWLQVLAVVVILSALVSRVYRRIEAYLIFTVGGTLAIN